VLQFGAPAIDLTRPQNAEAGADDRTKDCLLGLRSRNFMTIWTHWNYRLSRAVRAGDRNRSRQINRLI